MKKTNTRRNPRDKYKIYHPDFAMRSHPSTGVELFPSRGGAGVVNQHGAKAPC